MRRSAGARSSGPDAEARLRAHRTLVGTMLFVLGFTAVFVSYGAAFGGLGTTLARVHRCGTQPGARGASRSLMGSASPESYRQRWTPWRTGSGGCTASRRPACSAPRCSACSSASVGPRASARRCPRCGAGPAERAPPAAAPSSPPSTASVSACRSWPSAWLSGARSVPWRLVRRHARVRHRDRRWPARRPRRAPGQRPVGGRGRRAAPDRSRILGDAAVTAPSSSRELAPEAFEPPRLNQSRRPRDVPATRRRRPASPSRVADAVAAAVVGAARPRRRSAGFADQRPWCTRCGPGDSSPACGRR